MGLLLRDKKATHLYALPFEGKLNNMLSDQSPTDFERTNMIGN